MRIEVYQEAPKEEEKVLRLRLVSFGPGEAHVNAVDENGKTLSTIVAICKDGIYRSARLSGGHGLATDESGRVRDITP